MQGQGSTQKRWGFPASIHPRTSGLSDHQKKWVQPKKLQKSNPSSAGETSQPSINAHTHKQLSIYEAVIN